MLFRKKLITSLERKNSHLCVGLDSRYDRIPDEFKKNSTVGESIFRFNKAVIESTHDIAASYKMNIAFYSGFGQEGLEGLRLTNEYLESSYPDIPRLADCKRSEMGESVTMVKQEIIDWLGFDCVMVTPWFGQDTVRDYLIDEHIGICVYVHDSNPTAAEFQDLELHDGRRVYEVVAEAVAKRWNTSGNVFVEAGATYPSQLRRIREIIGDDMVLMVAGIGPQGGRIDDLKGLFGRGGKRLLVNSSRGIIFAGEGKPEKEYFRAVRQAAKVLRDSLYRLSTKR